MFMHAYLETFVDTTLTQFTPGALHDSDMRASAPLPTDDVPDDDVQELDPLDVADDDDSVMSDDDALADSIRELYLEH
jgi:hypothetical protein